MVGIADHQELHPAEGFVVSAVPSQGHIDGIKQVCPYHGNLINNQKVQSADHLDAAFSQTAFLRHLIFGNKFLYLRKIWAERKLEERMDGDSSGIDCCDSRGRQDDEALGCGTCDIFEECCFTRACFPGKED